MHLQMSVFLLKMSVFCLLPTATLTLNGLKIWFVVTENLLLPLLCLLAGGSLKPSFL